MLNVVIAGAGIAGLAAAISLRRTGHTVHLYERSGMNNEIGAAINVPPNAIRFLIPWGLKPEEWRFVRPKKVTITNPFNLETISQALSTDMPMTLGGCPLYYAHRVDLHNALKWMATRPDGPGTPAVIHLKKRVIAYDSEAPSITLESGEVIRADVVIAADGIRSLACEVVTGSKTVPVTPNHHNYCYRFLISNETLEEDPETRFFNQDREGWCSIMPDDATSRRMIHYPCRNNTVHNFVGLFYDPKANFEAGEEDWQASVSMDDVVERFSDYSPKLHKVIKKATDARKWPLLYRHPISRWHKGRMALAGDSAHPMLPHHGQGGAQGMEDGVTLGIVLHGAATPDEIERRLALYERVRRERASVIQILSNVPQDQPLLVREELREYFTDEQMPKNYEDNIKHNFGFNIVRAAVETMRKYDPNFELPADFFEGEVLPAPGDADAVPKSTPVSVAARPITAQL